MMREWMTGALGGVALIAAAAPAYATVTVGDGYGNGIRLVSSSSTTAAAVSSSNQYEYNADPEAINAATLPTSPLVVISAATAYDVQGAAIAEAGASNTSTASFISAASGAVSFLGGANAVATGNDGLASAYNYYYLNYYFSTDAAATFSISYALSGPMLGCCGNSIHLDDVTTGDFSIYHPLYGTDLSGTLTADLIAGDVYGLTINKAEYFNVDAPYVRGIGTQNFNHGDRFDFSITSADDPVPAAVPEPASWVMMIGGFGLVGTALRRRRKKPGATVAFA